MNETLHTALIIGGCLFCYAIGRFCQIPQPQEQKTEQGLPSPSAIQRQLNELEPVNPLKVDGKLGKLTQEKWDRVYIEQSAKAAFAEVEVKP